MLTFTELNMQQTGETGIRAGVEEVAESIGVVFHFNRNLTLKLSQTTRTYGV